MTRTDPDHSQSRLTMISGSSSFFRSPTRTKSGSWIGIVNREAKVSNRPRESARNGLTCPPQTATASATPSPVKSPKPKSPSQTIPYRTVLPRIPCFLEMKCQTSSGPSLAATADELSGLAPPVILTDFVADSRVKILRMDRRRECLPLATFAFSASP